MVSGCVACRLDRHPEGPVLKLNLKLWGVTREELVQGAITSQHPRTRERFLALSNVANGSCATQVAGEIGPGSISAEFG